VTCACRKGGNYGGRFGVRLGGCGGGGALACSVFGHKHGSSGFPVSGVLAGVRFCGMPVVSCGFSGGHPLGVGEASSVESVLIAGAIFLGGECRERHRLLHQALGNPRLSASCLQMPQTVAAFWPIDRENRVFTGSGCWPEKHSPLKTFEEGRSDMEGEAQDTGETHSLSAGGCAYVWVSRCPGVPYYFLLPVTLADFCPKLAQQVKWLKIYFVLCWNLNMKHMRSLGVCSSWTLQEFKA